MKNGMLCVLSAMIAVFVADVASACLPYVQPGMFELEATGDMDVSSCDLPLQIYVGHHGVAYGVYPNGFREEVDLVNADFFGFKSGSESLIQR